MKNLKLFLKCTFLSVIFLISIQFCQSNFEIPVWSNAANIQIPVRAGNFASQSKNNNGYLYIVSGRNQNDLIIKTVQRYDVNLNVWDTLNPHPTGLLGGATAILKDSLYVIGGVVNPPGSGQNIVYKFNINANSWSTAAECPFNIVDAKAVSYQDSLIYIAGGFSNFNAGVVYLYNAVSNSWREADFLPCTGRRNFGGFAVTGDTLVYMCGTNSFGSSIYFDSVYVGVINQNNRADIAWTRGANFPGQTRTFFDACSWGNRGIIMTGGSTDNTFNSPSDECYTFSPGQNLWTQLPDKPTPWLTGQSGSVKLSNQIWKLICAGGYDSGYVNFTQILSDTLNSVGIGELNQMIANGFMLHQNYPNPFNPKTVIDYEITKTGIVSLKVFDVLGKEVQTIVSGRQTPGKYSVDFNAGNLTAGIYFYELSSDAFSIVKKMILSK